MDKSDQKIMKDWLIALSLAFVLRFLFGIFGLYLKNKLTPEVVIVDALFMYIGFYIAHYFVYRKRGYIYLLLLALSSAYFLLKLFVITPLISLDSNMTYTHFICALLVISGIGSEIYLLYRSYFMFKANKRITDEKESGHMANHKSNSTQD